MLRYAGLHAWHPWYVKYCACFKGENLDLFGAEWQSSISRDMMQKQVLLAVDESQPVPEPVQVCYCYCYCL